MPLFIASLNSGSNANCYYAGNEKEAVLIDAGLSCRETEKRMKKLGLDISLIKAIFITHEHSDHVTGLSGLIKKYQWQLYITAGTLQHTDAKPDISRTRSFSHGKTISIGELGIIPFRKSHDADDPHSFMISCRGINVGVITDIGYACKRVIKYFSQCHAAFLETNYCPRMLSEGQYPYHLQKRISGDQGHLSNEQALELFLNYRSPELRLLILSHLSRNNNRPELVESLFRPHAGDTEVVVASRYQASPVFKLEETAMKLYKRTTSSDERQLTLF
jgi:phosphoribosyl 1,2-cyclic phosphodiesterase